MHIPIYYVTIRVMKHPVLNAQKREILGKKVKNLRKQGILPANVYGKELSSVSLQVDAKEFVTVYKEVGETGLVDLMVDDQKRPVLIKSVQFEFRNRTPVHTDFFQVNLKEKVKAMVPLLIVGEASAVTNDVGTLLQTLNEIEVEALPEALPENVEVNIENLAEVDDQIMISELKAPEGVTILTDESQVVAKIAAIEIEEEPEPEVVEGEEGAATEGEAGEEGTDGEAKSEDGEEKPAEESKEE